MLKILLTFAVFVATAKTFDYVQFQRKYCYIDTDIQLTGSYFPNSVVSWSSGLYSSPTGYVCEHFVLTKDDLDFMARNSFVLSSEERVVFKSCEIDYFNEYLVSKFPKLHGLYFENCNLSLKNPDEVIESATISGDIWTLGFHQCNIFDNLNSLSLQKIASLRYILIQNSTLQYSKIDEHFLPKKNHMRAVLIDNVNVKTFNKGFLANMPHDAYEIACSSCQLEEIEPLFYNMKKRVDYSISFDNNSIKKLPSSFDIFENFFYLRQIHLSGNEITEPLLKRIHFKALKNLQILDLSRNKNINGISNLTFKDTKLKILNMSNVNLETLGKLGNGNLTTIDFSHNDISTIQHNVFEGLINLIFLDISHNKIEIFQQAVFQSLASLKFLDLSFNYLERLEGLESLVELQELHLQHNYLKMIPSSISLPNTLMVLNISHNSLTFIGRNTFSNILQLTSLDISYTNNTYIDFDKESFRQLRSLRILKIAGNSISNIEDIFFPISLKELDLGNNNISIVVNKGLENLVNLEYLNLADNNIYVFEQGLLGKLSKIKHVDLSGNYLKVEL